MRYANVIQSFLNTPWVVLPQHYETLAGILRDHQLGDITQDLIRQRLQDAPGYGLESPDSNPPKGVGFMQLHGTILNRAGLLGDVSGATSPQQVERATRALADDPQVSEIVISVDSPGGQALNIDEAAAAVRYAASLKPVTAVANGYMASGAYWIASQASRIVTTPLSAVGSIGVLAAHADRTRMLENEGIDMRIYRTGSRKALGQDVDPNDGDLADDIRLEQEAILQVFASDVAAGRGLAIEEVLERYALDSGTDGALAGGILIGEAAVDAGLADEVGTLNQVLSAAVERTARRNRKRPRMRAQIGRTMNLHELVASLGLPEDATTEDIQAALTARERASVTRERRRVATMLGLPEDADLTDQTFTQVQAQAVDGRAYRTAQLDRLHALTIRCEGNNQAGQDAADRARRIYSSVSMDDLQAEIARLEKRVEDLPNKRLSRDPKDGEEAQTAKKVDYSRV